MDTDLFGFVREENKVRVNKYIVLCTKLRSDPSEV